MRRFIKDPHIKGLREKGGEPKKRVYLNGE